MSRTGRGPYLWLEPERYVAARRRTRPAVWIIRDGRNKRSTGCGIGDREGAEQALGAYISEKRFKAATQGTRDPAQIPVADVLNLYLRDIARKHARPHETAARIRRLLEFFGRRHLAAVNGDLCRKYAELRGDGTARRELEDLRAAINHHREEGKCSEFVGVVLPDAGNARTRWLTRSEAARLIWSAWRYREVQKGFVTGRPSRQHVARFILVALYTGTRAGAVCGAALQPTEGRGWIDLQRGVFYRRPEGKRETKKRQPPVPLPDNLLAHLRRWRRHGARYAVEWNGEPIQRVNKAFRAAADAAGLGPDVIPHTLRHTAATWLMQNGTDLWEAAGYLGMTVEMLSSTYGHHHPRHLENARTGFRKRRLGDNMGDNYAGMKSEQTRNNVTKIRGILRGHG